jgi:flagellin-like hook-associated protein FlgL
VSYDAQSKQLTIGIDPNNPPTAAQMVELINSTPDIREEFATATITSNGGRNADWTLTAKHAGATYNNVSVRVIHDPGGLAVKYDPLTKELTVYMDEQRNPSTAEEIIALINGDSELSQLFSASLPPHSNGQGLVQTGDRGALTGGIVPVDTRAEGSVIASGGVNSSFSIQAKRADSQFHNTEIIVVPDASGPKVSYDAQSKQLTIGIDPSNPPTAAQMVELINSTPDIRDMFSASIPTFADGTTIVPDGRGLVNVGDFGVLQANATGTSMGASMLGASDNESVGLVFYSVEYGSQEFVSVWGTHTSDFPVVDRFSVVTERAIGKDVVADINGRRAIGVGRSAISSTTDLDIEIATNPAVQAGDVFGFRISGGGTLMQLGPNASWTQQVRVSIPSVHATALGGESGTLSQLKSDEPFSLLANPHQAWRIIEEADVIVATTRGRLGALQRSRVEMSMEHMSDAITLESEARSQIADVEFAAESSELARQQLLMQSSVTVLQQSGQIRQLLLSLLQR